MEAFDGSNGNCTQLIKEVASRAGEQLLNIENNSDGKIEVMFLCDPGGEPRQFVPGRQKLLRSVLQKYKGPCGKLRMEGLLDESDRIDDVID